MFAHLAFRRTVLAATCSAMLAFAVSALAAGAPDPGFGAQGRVITDFSAREDQSRALAVQPDGRILAVGRAYPAGTSTLYGAAVARYTSSGALDTSFNATGRLVLMSPVAGYAQEATAVAVQGDGKILVAGADAAGLVVMRLNASGSPDQGFGTGGRVAISCLNRGCVGSEATKILLLASGRIWVVGSLNIMLDDVATYGVVTALTAEGLPDTAVGPNGQRVFGFISTLNGVSVPSSGILDAIEQGSGVVYAAAAGADGTAGVSNLLIGKLKASDASDDVSFGTAGRTLLAAGVGESFTSLVALADGRLVAAGGVPASTADLPVRLRRFSASGIWDPSFGEPQISTGGYNPKLARDGARLWLATQSGGVGAGDFTLSRLTLDGAFDSTFGSAGRLQVDLGGNDRLRALALGSDGRPVLAGLRQVGTTASDFALLRVDPNLSAPGSAVPAAPSGLVATPSGARAISLRWADNANNETGYRIERSTSPSFSAAIVTTTAANVSTLAVSGLQPSTTYFFRLTAVNAAGASAAATTSTTTPRR